MSANVFDQFDSVEEQPTRQPPARQAAGGNVFDQFDDTASNDNTFDRFDGGASQPERVSAAPERPTQRGVRPMGAGDVSAFGDHSGFIEEAKAGWQQVTKSQAFRQGDWQTRQRMRGQYLDSALRSRLPADEYEQVLGEFMTATEEDVMRPDPLTQSMSLNAGYGGGLADQRALQERRQAQQQPGLQMPEQPQASGAMSEAAPAPPPAEDDQSFLERADQMLENGLRAFGLDGLLPERESDLPDPTTIEDPQQRAQVEAQALREKGSVLTDFGNLLSMGADRAALNTRELVRRTFGEGVVDAIDRADEWLNGQESEELLTQRIERNEGELTPETMAAREKAWWDSEEGKLGPAWTDWRSYFSGITESLPETAMTMAPSMALSKGVYAWNIARGVGAKTAAKRAATTATLAGGLSEGALGGAASSREVREAIRNMPEEQLRESEAIRSLMDQGGMTFEQARDTLAEDASSQAFVTSAAVTGAFGGMGDRALARIITGGPTSRLGAALRGAVGEGVFEEMPQEAGQQVSENLAMRRADESVGALDDVPNAALGGLAIGAGMGAGMGAAAGGQQESETQTPQDPEAGQPGERRQYRSDEEFEQAWREHERENDLNPIDLDQDTGVRIDIAPNAELIRTPRHELTTEEREARDSLTYGEDFKALRSAAEARGDTQAVAELDAVSEEVSDLLEEETLARTRGESLAPIRERLGAAADRFAQVTDRIRTPEGEQRMGLDLPTDDLRQQVEQAAAETDTTPTPNQAQAGNYRKGRVRLHGFEVAIENPKGSTRRGVAPDGTEWANRMGGHYGDLKGTEGADGDNLDVFVGDNPASSRVFVVDQVNDDGAFDETKILMGYDSLEEARQAYLSSYDENWQGLGEITETSLDDFRQWVREGNTRAPFAMPPQAANEATGQAINPEARGQQQGQAQGATENVPEAQRETTYLPDNTPVETRFRVVDLADLTPSNRADGQINPAFPTELQPRDRTNANSQVQVRNIAARLNPERLGASPDAGTGAPIIGTDGVVESGNGRTMAIASAYQQGGERARAYRDYVRRQAEERGIAANLEGMRRPVLVRERMTDIDRAEFARRSNESQVAGMTAYEQAMADADALTADELLAWSPDQAGDPLAASNRNFQRAFVARLGNNEAARYTTRSGQAAPELGQRMSRAVFAKAYAEPDMVEMVTEQGDQMRNLAGALQSAAPDLAMARETGNQEALDTIGMINEAVRLVRASRRDGVAIRELIGQADAFSEPVSETAGELAILINTNMRSRASLENALTYVAQDARRRAETALNGALFEDTTTSEDAIREGFQQAQDTGPVRAPEAGDSGGPGQGAGELAAGREADPAEGAPEAQAVTLRPDGTPFQTRRAAELSRAYRETPGAQAVAVEGGWGVVTPDAPLLETYTEQDVAQREQAAQQAQEEEARTQREAEQRADADREADDFRLTGSDRPADVAAAGGQQDLLGAGASRDAPSSTSRRSMAGMPEAIIHAPLSAERESPDYRAAKSGDPDAAMRYVESLVTVKGLRQIREALGGRRPIVVPVRAEESAGRNKVPSAYASVLAEALELDMDGGIVQANRPRRTELDGLERLFTQPEFDGPVEAGRDYLIVDDTLTQGGTIAALKGRIEANGGRVILAGALTGKQYSATLSPDPALLETVRERFGDLEADFIEAQGYGYDQLTQSEARYLANLTDKADAFRDRVIAQRNAARRAADGAARRQQPEGSAAQGRASAVDPSGRDQSALFAFAGERAQTANTRHLESAQQRIAAGENAETVRRETGWFQGPDERWRFEINDSDARFLPFTNGTAGELWTESLDRVLDFPALFAAYPDLRHLDVVSARGMGNRRGQFRARSGEIMLNAERGAMEQFSTLLHEIQHGIQHLEGFATGGDPTDYRLPPLREKWLKDRVHALGRESSQHAAQLMERQKAGEITLEEVQQGIRQYADEIGLNELRRQLNEGNERGAFRYYQRLAGEVEARNVQARQGMSDADRRTTPPLETADVPPSEVVVVYNGQALEQAPPPANADAPLPPNDAPYVSDVSRRLAEHPALAGVRAIQSVSELPAHVLDTMEARGIDAGQVAGVYDPTGGQSYVVADNLMDAEEGVRRAVHEAVGHQGIHGVLGADVEKVMVQVFQSYRRSAAGNDALREIRRAYPYLNPETHAGRVGIAEELVARSIEQSDGRPALRERVMAAIRRALRALFPGVAWTDADIRVMGERARRYMAKRQATRWRNPDDPAAAAGLRSVVRAEGNERGVAVGEAQRVVDDFMSRYQGNIPLQVRVAATQEELYGPRASIAKVGRLKGAYHPARGVMTIVAGNANGVRDIQRTLRHEILGHYGLNTFTPTEKRALLDRLLETQRSPSLAAVWDTVRRNYPDAPLDIQAEEIFAHVAEVERTTLGQAWDRVLTGLQRAVRAAGLSRGPLRLAELHELARQIGEGVRTGRRAQQTFPATDDAQFSQEARDDTAIRFSLKEDQPESVSGPYGPNDSTGFALPDESYLDRKLRVWADKMRPLKRLRRAIQQSGGNIEEEADPYLAEELYHGRLEKDLEDFRHRYVEPLAEGLAKAKISQADLDDYVYALHAPERNAVVAERNPNDESLQDGGSGMTNAEAAEIVEKVRRSGKQEAYDRLAKIVHDITAVRREAIREGGLETDDVLDAWEATYQSYVPLKGYANDEPEAPRIGKGFQITGKESFLVKGRRDRAASPSTQAIVDANMSLIRRRKNEVGNAFLSMVTDHPNPALWEVFTDDNPDTERATVRVTDPETGEKRWEVREQPVQMRRDDRYFKTKRAGRTYFIKVKDQRLLNAMRNVGPESNFWITRVAGAATRIMSSLVTSYNPEFLVTNFERDIQTALLNVGAEQTRDDGKIKGQQILWDTARDVRPAMRAAWRGLNRSKASRKPGVREWDRWFQEFIEDGAKTGYFDMKDIEAQAKEISAMVRRADGSTMSHMLKARKKTADFVENVNGAVENAVRLSAYANARRNGLSRRQAASLAKNLTVNFNRRGEIGTGLNAAYMFANASIQGSMNFARVMVTLKNTPEGKSPLNVWARMNLGQKIGFGMATAAFALARLNRWLSDEDEDGVLFWDKVENHIKERHFVLMTGWLTGNPEDNIKIPLPYGYNVFAVAGTHLEKLLAGQQTATEAGTSLGLAVAGSFSPIGFEDSNSLSGLMAKNLTPTLARSLVQLGWNEDFAARMVYRENDPFGIPSPESALYMRSTPEGYKTIAKVLNDITGGSQYVSGGIDINPDVIQHLVNYYGGGAWGFVEKTTDFAARTVSGQEVETYRIPFAGKLLGSVTPYQDQSLFYQRRDELGQIYREAENLTGQEGVAYRAENRGRIRLYLDAVDISNNLRDLRQERDIIETSENLDDETKRKRLEDVEQRMKFQVDRFNRQYNALEE